MDSWTTPALGLIAGVAVAAVSGLRAFLPLLAVGLAGRLGWIELQPAAHWLASDAALIGLGFAALLEIAADKFPVVDHVLDLFATAVRPVAAAIASYGVLSSWPSPWAQVLALTLGAGALAVHVAKAKVRLGSTAATAGQANPLVSTAEDGVTLATLLVVFLAPVVALVAAGVLLWLLWRLGRRHRRPGHAATP